MAVHRSPDERRAMVADWLASDLTTEDFARRRGVSITSLYRWRRQLEDGEDAGSAADFVELVAASEESPPPGATSPKPAPIELRLDGVTVLVRPGVDGETLLTVLSAVRAAS